MSVATHIGDGDGGGDGGAHVIVELEINFELNLNIELIIASSLEVLAGQPLTVTVLNVHFCKRTVNF